MRTSRFTRRSTNRTTTNRTTGWRTTTSSNTGRSFSASSFNKVTSNIQQKIGSFRNIYSQCTGTGTTFSPATANKWINLVNNGAFVYKFTGTDFARWFGTNYNPSWSPTTAMRHCRQRFGTGIKAVNRGRGNCWLVCASSSTTARPFNTYNWSN